MTVRLILLLVLLLSSLGTIAKEKFDVDNHDAYLGIQIPVHYDREILIKTNGVIKEWIEIDINLSRNHEIIDYKIRSNSGNELFNQSVVDQLPLIAKTARAKKKNGKAVSSTFKYRYDIYFNGLDDYEGVLNKGHPKLMKSTVKTEDHKSKKKVLIYFQHEVPKGVFKSSKVSHQKGDFTAIKIEKNKSIPNRYQASYAKQLGFNSLKNKELLSFYEFFEAYNKYINWPGEIIYDENKNIINPETVNEHKPLSEKTQYWTTRPKSARPQFKNAEHLFGNYYAELDAINYTGKITLHSHVEPTGLLINTTIINGSGFERLDQITLKVLKHLYIKPAYKNHNNVADEIEFEINFYR